MIFFLVNSFCCQSQQSFLSCVLYSQHISTEALVEIFTYEHMTHLYLNWDLLLKRTYRKTFIVATKITCIILQLNRMLWNTLDQEKQHYFFLEDISENICTEKHQRKVELKNDKGINVACKRLTRGRTKLWQFIGCSRISIVW